MNIEQIENLSNVELLDIYTLFVTEHHYCPYEMPEEIKDLYKNNISTDDIYQIVLNRMSMNVKKNEENENSLNLINNYLLQSDRYGLTAEVIYSALKYMQENNSTIEIAMRHGLNEWIK